jgi:glycine cleavage system aminomethyltransferase T
VWEAIMQAGREFGIEAIGLEALKELERVAG